MNTILSRAWWKAAGLRALKTAIALAVPYLVGSVLGDVEWLTIASAAGLGAVVSLLTSLFGIPDSAGVPLWVTLLEKAVKTAAQALAVGIGNAVVFQDVSWSTIVPAAALSTLVTLLTVVAGKIPDVNPNPVPVVIEPAHTITINDFGNSDALNRAAAQAVAANLAPRPPSE
jgi:hypothetical protein